MSRLAFLASLLVARVALPCGGGFGQGIEIDPEQTIVLAFDGTTETYVFSPHFCGDSEAFGLILPLPALLSSNPTLADEALFEQLDEVSAPRIVTECASSRSGCADSMRSAPGDYADRDFYTGVEVVDAGQVGIFDWVLLQADTSAAFTDWLDSHGFPHDAAAAPHFDYYVAASWYFVAFRVTAGEQAPPAGQKLCGDLGPLVLRFPADQPVIPARIASVNASEFGANAWRVYAIAPTQMRLVASPGFADQLGYSGVLGTGVLGHYPAIRTVAAAGDRLTRLDVHFPYDGANVDILLETDPDEADFRAEIIEYEECGCAAAYNGWLPLLVVLGLLAAAVTAKRHWPRKRGQSPFQSNAP